MAAAGGSGSEKKRRSSKDESVYFRMVLVGRTGAGKSSSGNTILGRDAFRAAVSHSSVTRECRKETAEVWGRTLAVVDTPGLFDTGVPDHATRREIWKCINMSAPGPHAVLLVVRVGRFTAEEQESVRRVEEIFGEGAWRYTMVLFTQDDQQPLDLERQLQGAGPEMQALLHKTGRRFHLLNNSRTHDRAQVLALLEKVEHMVLENGGRCYSNGAYQQAALLLEQRERELRALYEQRLEEEVRAVTSRYQKMLEEEVQQRHLLEERLQRELEETRRFHRLLLDGARRLVEQTTAQDSMDAIVTFRNTLRLQLT